MTTTALLQSGRNHNLWICTKSSLCFVLALGPSSLAPLSAQLLRAMPATCPAWLAELSAKFELSRDVTAWLHLEPENNGLGLTNISDFVKAATEEKRWDSLIKRLAIPDKVRQGARIKLAWASIIEVNKEAADKKLKGDLTDYDTLLPGPDLIALHLLFFRRYMVTHPPEVAPADLVISRLRNELNARALSVRDLSWVKTQDQQIKSRRKSEEVAKNLYHVTSDLLDTPYHG